MPLNSFVSHLPVCGLLLLPVLLISFQTLLKSCPIEDRNAKILSGTDLLIHAATNLTAEYDHTGTH